MLQKLKFFLTLALLKDPDSGDYTAYYVQFPEASAQGKTKRQAKKLLNEIFPYLLKSKKEEFINYHKDQGKNVTFIDSQMFLTNETC